MQEKKEVSILGDNMKRIIVLFVLLLVGCSNAPQPQATIQGDVRSIPYISDECQYIQNNLRVSCIKDVNSIECKSLRYDWKNKCEV